MTHPCPVLETAALTAHTAADLTIELRTIRNMTKRCKTCQLNQHCEALDAYNNAIDSAVRKIAEEYGLC
jgi:hypothetical protein